MADDEDDIVWIREDTEGSPTTPATIIEVAPVLSDAFEPRGPPEVTISAPPPTPPALALITIELTEAPPTKQEATPTEAPPTEAPPPETQAPPPEAPPPTVEAPPTNGQAPPPQVEAPPTEAPPTQAPPTEAPPPTTQDQLSAKLDPKTPNSVDDNSLTFDLSECERNFNKAIREASDILEDFDEKSKQVAENTKFVARELAELAASAPRVFQKTIDDKSQVPEISELPSGGLPKNVESVLIGEGVLEEITGTLVLPNGLVLVTDERAGIFLFDLEGNVKAKINPPEFRKLWSPVYHKEHILVLADAKNGDDHWVRHVIKFTFQLEYVAKIECPSWLAECTILRERLSIAHNDHLYLCVCGEIFSGLYELTPVGQWTELEYKLSEAYVDMLAFATIGPITQLLVVEGRRNYVLLVSIRESRVVDKKRMAICERPGALARDEAGRLFVANRFSASIQLVDTMRWVSDKNVAITDAFVRHFSACWGLLAIPLKTAVRLQRYSFRSLR